jgi:guanyl-specific ribonuclease Sa
MKGWRRFWIWGLLLCMALMSSTLAGCGVLNEVLEQTPSSSGQEVATPDNSSTASPLDAQFEELVRKDSSLEEFREVALYLIEHNQLPHYYLTKSEARKLGWVAQEGNLRDVAPDGVIGGDLFQNREGLLPKAKGRTWYEADIHYTGGTRGADRLLYSSDGLIYMTRDHYKTFTLIYGGEE